MFLTVGRSGYQEFFTGTALFYKQMVTSAAASRGGGSQASGYP
jgi:hypothetical protein